MTSACGARSAPGPRPLRKAERASPGTPRGPRRPAWLARWPSAPLFLQGAAARPRPVLRADPRRAALPAPGARDPLPGAPLWPGEPRLPLWEGGAGDSSSPGPRAGSGGQGRDVTAGRGRGSGGGTGEVFSSFKKAGGSARPCVRGTSQTPDSQAQPPGGRRAAPGAPHTSEPRHRAAAPAAAGPAARTPPRLPGRVVLCGGARVRWGPGPAAPAPAPAPAPLRPLSPPQPPRGCQVPASKSLPTFHSVLWLQPAGAEKLRGSRRPPAAR